MVKTDSSLPFFCRPCKKKEARFESDCIDDSDANAMVLVAWIACDFYGELVI